MAGLRGLGGFLHPPLTSFIFISAVKIFGAEHLRLLPFVFGMANFWLLFWILKNKFSFRVALWGVFFYSIVFYSVLASLMVDTDGQILPFFFLISTASYYKWLEKDRELNTRLHWACLMIFSMICGLLTKASFVIGIGAISLDFLYSNKNLLRPEKIFRTLLIFLSCAAFAFLIILGAMYFLPNSDISKPLAYWKHFFVLHSRNYLQVSIEFFKSLLYLSPLFFVSLFLLSKETFNKIRLFLFFILLGLIFYLFIFDFSSGALDRYLQFLIVPAVIIMGVIIDQEFSRVDLKTFNKKKSVILSVVLASGIFLFQFLHHFVPALYPKEEWFRRFLSFRWNFLFPFMGGSGPMGFYVSWLFISLIWILILFFGAYFRFGKRRSNFLWFSVLVLGILYNSVFVEEYLFGKINGSSNMLLKNAVVFIKNDKDISSVISYNNIGNRELSNMGKFERRLYIAPKFEKDYTNILRNFRGHFLVIDIPRFHADSPFLKYFSSCKTIYDEHSGQINSKIFDCRQSKVRFDKI